MYKNFLMIIHVSRFIETEKKPHVFFTKQSSKTLVQLVVKPW